MKTRAAAALLTGLAVALSLTGCAFITPQQTSVSYQPSDGVNGQVGRIDLRNVMLISTNGTAANLIAVMVNTGDTSATVQVQYDSKGTPTSQSVVVPANESVSLRPGSGSVLTLSPISAPLGSLFDVSFVVGSASSTIQVPVLNTSLPGYSTLAPTPGPSSTETAGPTLTPTPTETATPATSTPVPSPSDSPSS